MLFDLCKSFGIISRLCHRIYTVKIPVITVVMYFLILLVRMTEIEMGRDQLIEQDDIILQFLPSKSANIHQN